MAILISESLKQIRDNFNSNMTTIRQTASKALAQNDGSYQRLSEFTAKEDLFNELCLDYKHAESEEARGDILEQLGDLNDEAKAFIAEAKNWK